LIVDLDELNIGELFEIEDERARDVIERAIGLTVAREIDMRNTIGVFKFAIAREAIEDESDAFVAFDTAGTFEEFVEDAADQILR
jgi:hypothetical protein